MSEFDKQRTHCNFFAYYNTDLLADISKQVKSDHILIIVKFSVEFNKPVATDPHAIIPLNHMPANPTEVGIVSKARLTYYVNNLGDWLFSVITFTGKNAVNFERVQERNRVRETWTFNYNIPLDCEWDSFRGEFDLLPAYENQFSHARCAYYQSENLVIYNGGNSINPHECKLVTPWEPSETDLPESNYDVVRLNPGDLFGMRYPTKVNQVLVAPPKHQEQPYSFDIDYWGCFHNNIVKLSFHEPGIYAIRVLFQGGSDTRFFLVGATFENVVYPFGRMVEIPTPNYTAGYAFSGFNDYGVFQIANNFLPGMTFVNTGSIVAALNGYVGDDPVTMILCGDGDNNEVMMDDESWFMDGSCNPSPALARFVAAAHGIVRVLYIFNANVAVGLSSNCHVMKYIANTLVAASLYNPYGSPYRPPLDYALVYACDGPVAVVDGGRTRPGYFCRSASGTLQSFMATPGAGLVSLASGRESTKEKPSFYNKLEIK